MFFFIISDDFRIISKAIINIKMLLLNNPNNYPGIKIISNTILHINK